MVNELVQVVSTPPDLSADSRSWLSEAMTDSGSFRKSRRARRRQVDIKAIASARERSRVRAMAAAFRDLRDRLPRHPAEYQLTHEKTISRAIAYIRFLNKELAGNQPTSLRRVHEIVVGESVSSPSSLRSELSSDFCGFSENGKSESLVASPEISVGRLIPRHRVKWSAKCRKRCREISRAFDMLREVLAEGDEKKPRPYGSQASTLRQAIDYIRSLRNLLADGERAHTH